MDLGQIAIPHRVWHEDRSRTALLLHCSLAHSGAFSGLSRHLPELRLVAPDQAGHGHQPAWDGRTHLHDQTLADALDLAPERFDLVGHSFGATVALRIALAHPRRVQSLTLIEPPLFAAARLAGAPAHAPHHARHSRIEALIHEGRRDEALAAFHADWGGASALADLPERVVDYMRDRIHLIAAQGEVLSQDSLGLLRPGGLEALRLPVLLIEGEKSPPIAGAIHAALAARIPGARREIVAGAGHMLPITHAAEVAALVRPHLGLPAA